MEEEEGGVRRKKSERVRREEASDARFSVLIDIYTYSLDADASPIIVS
jgi:hypothetical protein